MPKQDNVQEIINKSGNNLHSKVVEFLRKNGWTVLISPYYNDNQTNKAREIDIIAEKEVPVHKFGGQWGTINVQLFIECKYIQNEVVFWFDERDMHSAEEMVFKTTCLQRNNGLTKQHHYLQNHKVAKLFSSNPKKINENEDFYKALNQVLNGMIYHRSRHRTLIKREGRKNFEHIVCYPIVLCNNFNSLFKTEIGSQGHSAIDTSDFQLEVNYSYLSKGGETDEYFLIDVVDFTKFENYLKNLFDGDIKAMESIASF